MTVVAAGGPPTRQSRLGNLHRRKVALFSRQCRRRRRMMWRVKFLASAAATVSATALLGFWNIGGGIVGGNGGGGKSFSFRGENR